MLKEQAIQWKFKVPQGHFTNVPIQDKRRNEYEKRNTRDENDAKYLLNS